MKTGDIVFWVVAGLIVLAILVLLSLNPYYGLPQKFCPDNYQGSSDTGFWCFENGEAKLFVCDFNNGENGKCYWVKE